MVKNKSHLVFTAKKEDGEPVFDDTKLRYLVYGDEVGKKSNYEHYQGYLELIEPEPYDSLHQWFHPTAHFAIRRGSKEQAIGYAKKDGKFVEFGEPDSQGARHDLEASRELIASGVDRKSIADHDFSTWCRNWRAFDQYADMCGPPDKPDAKIVYVFGPPDTGKSTIGKYYIKRGAYKKACHHKWWNGYWGQDTVVMDEFRDGRYSIDELLDMVSYGFQFDLKGTTVWSRVTTYIIISNYSFEENFGRYDEVTRKALARRIKKTIYVPKVGLALVLPSPTSPLPPPLEGPMAEPYTPFGSPRVILTPRPEPGAYEDVISDSMIMQL